MFSKYTREGESGILSHMCDVGPYTRVGRVADSETWVWARAIFEHSGSVLVRGKATLIVNQGSTIYRGLVELLSINQVCKIDLKLTLYSEPSTTPSFCGWVSDQYSGS